MASENVVEFTVDNWESEVTKSDKPVLVDFWAPWCQPCRRMNPTIDKIADEYAGKVKVGKLDTQDHPDLAVKYGVTGIPRLLVFPGGTNEPQGSMVGVQSEGEIKSALDSVLQSVASK